MAPIWQMRQSGPAGAALSELAKYLYPRLRILMWIKALHAQSRNSELTVIKLSRYNLPVLQRG
jgi:hypothetical protein